MSANLTRLFNGTVTTRPYSISTSRPGKQSVDANNMDRIVRTALSQINFRMLKKAFILTRPPQRAETRLSTGKAAADQLTSL